MNEWMNEWMESERTNERTNERMNERTNKWMLRKAPKVHVYVQSFSLFFLDWEDHLPFFECSYSHTHTHCLLRAGQHGLPPTPDNLHLGCSYHLQSPFSFHLGYGHAIKQKMFAIWEYMNITNTGYVLARETVNEAIFIAGWYNEALYFSVLATPLVFVC